MKNSEGFTLIELIVVITILTLIVAALSTLFESSMHSWNRVNNQTELQQNLRFALNKITDDIKNSKGILRGSNENVIVLQMSANTIEYGLKAKDEPEDDESLYQLTGRALYKKESDGGNNENPVTTYIINDLTFTYNTPDDPKDATYVEITIQGVYKKKPIIYQSGAEVKWKSFGFLNQ